MSALSLQRLLCLLGTTTLATTAALTAQSPLTTTFANNNGNAVGGMMFFDLNVTEPAGIQIHTIDINTSAAAGGLSIWTVPTTWVGSESNPAAWTLQAAGAFDAGAGAGAPTPVCLGGGFYLAQGTYGVAIEQGASTNMNYTTGTAPFQLIYSTTELTLTAGAANNVPFAGAPFNPRVINANVHYNVGPVPGSCAVGGSSVTYGVGCNSDFASFYEELATASFDLTDTDISGSNTLAGYVVQVTPGAGILPVGAIGTATTLTMPDDGQVPAGTLGMVVGSNGWVAQGGGNSNGFTPSAQTMLNNPAEGIYAWTDLQPNNSGTVTYEEDPATGNTRTTFDAVNGWNTTDPHYIQFDFNTNTGDWVIRFGTVGFANPEDWVVGYSQAGPNGDPGSMDLSAAGTFTTPAGDVLPLSIASDTPSLGATWNVTTTNIDPMSPLAITFFGDSGPAIPLTAIGFNAPGCDINLASAISNIASPNVGGTAVVNVAIPNLPALTGFSLSAQSICLTLTNAAGILSSDATTGTIGGTLSGFVDLDYTARSIVVDSPLGASQTVVLDGLATVNPVGAINGTILATFSGGATASVDFQNDNVVVTCGGTVMDMNLNGASGMFLVNGVPTSLDTIYAAFHADTTAGGDPGTWSETSQATLATTAIIETIEFINNIGWAKWLKEKAEALLCRLVVNYAAEKIKAWANANICANIGAACNAINVQLAPWIAINCPLLVAECANLVGNTVDAIKAWVAPLIWNP